MTARHDLSLALVTIWACVQRTIGLYCGSGTSFHTLNYEALWLTPLLYCRGFCSRHPNYVPLKKIDYARGMKVCITCYRVVFVGDGRSKVPLLQKKVSGRARSTMAQRAGWCAWSQYDHHHHILARAVMPRMSRAFLSATPNAPTSASRAARTSLSCSFSTGTFS